MIPLKMRRLFFGFTPRRLLGINGSILAHCPSLNQNKFARICWPPIRLTNPLNLNMVNWVLTLDRSARIRLSNPSLRRGRQASVRGQPEHGKASPIVRLHWLRATTVFATIPSAARMNTTGASPDTPACEMADPREGARRGETKIARAANANQDP